MRVLHSNALRQQRLIRNFERPSHRTYPYGCYRTTSRGLHTSQHPFHGPRQHIYRCFWSRDRYLLYDGWRRHVRDFSATIPSRDTVKDVAILGGGITGLATAHYLSEEYPDAKITLYESKPHLGGWMNSKAVDVGDGEVIFESGPRSLRPQAPNGTLALRLVWTRAVESLHDCID